MSKERTKSESKHNPVGDRPLAKVARPEGPPKVATPTNHWGSFFPFGLWKAGMMINPRRRRPEELVDVRRSKETSGTFGTWRATRSWRTMKAKPRKAWRRSSPKVPKVTSRTFGTWRATRRWWTMKAKPCKARRRPSPKVAEHHETRDPGRSVQVGLSYLGKLLNIPIVINWPPEKQEGHFWNVGIRLGV